MRTHTHTHTPAEVKPSFHLLTDGAQETEKGRTGNNPNTFECNLRISRQQFPVDLLDMKPVSTEEGNTFLLSDMGRFFFMALTAPRVFFFLSLPHTLPSTVFHHLENGQTARDAISSAYLCR